MTAMTKILTGAAGLAAMVGFASPAAAQYYPSPYGNNGGVLGTILNGVLGGGGQYGGYNSYGNNSQMAVNQCAGAVGARLSGQRYGGYQGGYGGNWGGYSPYGGYNNYAAGRVTQITRVERRSNGGLKVYGLAQSAAAARAYSGGYGGYGSYGGYNSGYGVANADLMFNCKLDAYGRITDVDIDRNDGRQNYGYRGY